MNRSAALVIGPQCRFCGAVVSNSVAPRLGSESAGYTCPDCIVKHQADIAQLGREMSETPILLVAQEKDECARCHCRPDGRDWFLLFLDNRAGLYCPDCEVKIRSSNRSQVKGTAAESAWKLA